MPTPGRVQMYSSGPGGVIGEYPSEKLFFLTFKVELDAQGSNDNNQDDEGDKLKEEIKDLDEKVKEKNEKNVVEKKLSHIAQRILEQAETGDMGETFDRLKEVSDQLVSHYTYRNYLLYLSLISFCLSVCLYFYLFICPSACLCLSVCLSIYIYLSVIQFVCLCIE